jgi:type II secretion system protein N
MSDSFGTMNKKTWILYGFYAAVVAVFFFYYLFPSQSLKAYIISQAGKVNPDFSLSAGKAELVFPYRIRLHQVDLNYLADRLIEAEELTLAPRLQSLISRKSTFAFSMNAHRGLITGTADISGGKRLVLNAVASGVQLADIPFLKNMSSNRVEGVLQGAISYAAGNGRLETLNVDLDITDMTIVLASPFFTLEKINFDIVEADAVLQNQQLKISRIILTGDQIEGNLSGYASMPNDIRQTNVNLSGTVMPQQQFVESSGFQIPPPFLDSLKTGGGIPIRISGPLDDLRLSTK